MDFDYGYGYLKIIGAGGAVEYTEFAGAVMTWSKSYTYLGDSVLSTITPNGSGGETTEFNHPDRLGTRLTTNQTTGTSTEQASLPFGTALGSETTPNNNTKKFTSYERSARTGLDYAINRTYDSKLGRFTQVDPIGMKATNLEVPKTLNLYNYCGNDPINRTDPEGLFWGALGRFFQKIGRAINKILGNIVVQIAITILASVVTLGMSLAAQIALFTAQEVIIPTWLAISSFVLTGVSYASKIATLLELSGILLQGKFKQFGKIVGLAIVGALAGIVEDSVRNGFWEGLKTGNPLSGAWKGFKRGLLYLKEVFSRKWQDFLIPVYGFFCAPGYGIDSSSGIEKPTDGQDKACRIHDEASRESKLFGYGKLRRDWIDIQLIGRSIISTTRARLVDRIFGSGYKIGDVYSTIVPFAFGSRIVGRHLGIGT